jgi:hypothetical protein
LTEGPDRAFHRRMAPARQNELDELVANTMAFVNSVKKGQVQPEAVVDARVADTIAVVNFIKEKPDQTEPVDAVVAVVNQALADNSLKPFAPMTWPTFGREEVTQRVANFKAHQLRMQSEREDYYFQTMTRTRAVIDNARAAPKGK